MSRDVADVMADLDAAQEQEQGADEVIVNEVVEDSPDDDEAPGFMGYDDWIAAGKDPDDYRGKNAYKAQYDNIQANKELKGELGDMKTMLNEVVSAAEQTRRDQIVAHKQELQAALDAKIEELHPKDAIEEQKKIDAIDTTPAPQAPHPMMQALVSDNPMIDQKSPDYNEDFAIDFWSYHDAQLLALGGDKRELPLRRLKSCKR